MGVSVCQTIEVMIEIIFRDVEIRSKYVDVIAIAFNIYENGSGAEQGKEEEIIALQLLSSFSIKN